MHRFSHQLPLNGFRVLRKRSEANRSNNPQPPVPGHLIGEDPANCIGPLIDHRLAAVPSTRKKSLMTSELDNPPNRGGRSAALLCPNTVVRVYPCENPRSQTESLAATDASLGSCESDESGRCNVPYCVFYSDSSSQACTPSALPRNTGRGHGRPYWRALNRKIVCLDRFRKKQPFAVEAAGAPYGAGDAAFCRTGGGSGNGKNGGYL